MDIQALNLTQRLAVLDDGTVVPITNLIDANGDDTTDEAEAVGFVAGEGRRWFSGAFSFFERVITQ